MDAIFIERLCRSLKLEAVHLEEIQDGFQARRMISSWMTFYTTERPHSSLDRKTLKEAFWHGRDQKMAARNLTRIRLGSAAELFGTPGPRH